MAWLAVKRIAVASTSMNGFNSLIFLRILPVMLAVQTNSASHREELEMFQATGNNLGRVLLSADPSDIRLNTLCQLVMTTKDVFAINSDKVKLLAHRAVLPHLTPILRPLPTPRLVPHLIPHQRPTPRQTLNRTPGRHGSHCRRFVTTLTTPARTTRGPCTKSIAKSSSLRISSSSSSRSPQTITSSTEHSQSIYFISLFQA